MSAETKIGTVVNNNLWKYIDGGGVSNVYNNTVNTKKPTEFYQKGSDLYLSSQTSLGSRLTVIIPSSLKFIQDICLYFELKCSVEDVYLNEWSGFQCIRSIEYRVPNTNMQFIDGVQNLYNCLELCANEQKREELRKVSSCTYIKKDGVVSFLVPLSIFGPSFSPKKEYKPFPNYWCGGGSGGLEININFENADVLVKKRLTTIRANTGTISMSGVRLQFEYGKLMSASEYIGGTLKYPLLTFYNFAPNVSGSNMTQGSFVVTASSLKQGETRSIRIAFVTYTDFILGRKWNGRKIKALRLQFAGQTIYQGLEKELVYHDLKYNKQPSIMKSKCFNPCGDFMWTPASCTAVADELLFWKFANTTPDIKIVYNRMFRYLAPIRLYLSSIGIDVMNTNTSLDVGVVSGTAAVVSGPLTLSNYVLGVTGQAYANDATSWYQGTATGLFGFAWIIENYKTALKNYYGYVIDWEPFFPLVTSLLRAPALNKKGDKKEDFAGTKFSDLDNKDWNGGGFFKAECDRLINYIMAYVAPDGNFPSYWYNIPIAENILNNQNYYLGADLRNNDLNLEVQLYSNCQTPVWTPDSTVAECIWKGQSSQGVIYGTETSEGGIISMQQNVSAFYQVNGVSAQLIS